jgi:hypothetical protein
MVKDFPKISSGLNFAQRVCSFSEKSRENGAN